MFRFKEKIRGGNCCPMFRGLPRGRGGNSQLEQGLAAAEGAAIQKEGHRGSGVDCPPRNLRCLGSALGLNPSSAHSFQLSRRSIGNTILSPRKSLTGFML